LAQAVNNPIPGIDIITRPEGRPIRTGAPSTAGTGPQGSASETRGYSNRGRFLGSPTLRSGSSSGPGASPQGEAPQNVTPGRRIRAGNSVQQAPCAPNARQAGFPCSVSNAGPQRTRTGDIPVPADYDNDGRRSGRTAPLSARGSRDANTAMGEISTTRRGIGRTDPPPKPAEMENIPRR
jgi:hypothetical protein